MRRMTMWITAVLSALILAYSHHANLTGDGGKTGDGNPACVAGAAAQPRPECEHEGKPGERK